MLLFVLGDVQGRPLAAAVNGNSLRIAMRLSMCLTWDRDPNSNNSGQHQNMLHKSETAQEKACTRLTNNS